MLYLTVVPFLDDLDASVRDTALSAALAFGEHPGLAGHRDGLAERARQLLRTSDTRWRRRQAIDALTAWNHDTTGLTRPGDDNRSPYASDLAEADWYPGPPF
ncbi:hypothetical protein GCM10009760_60990 [Kitasatospora kazusensis]|uniref:HEAT repeat domain-containing protein n=1 Tax=Kitasatospora kazusensis TaxID=407974 RepID=A0ABP5M573_9ACTN